MKKWVLTFAIGLFTFQSAFADGGGSVSVGGRVQYQTSGTLSVGEFLCAIAGGAAGGAILKYTVGGGDPVTFIGALFGGLIGVQFCKYLNNDVSRGLNQAAASGLNTCSAAESRWSGSEYHGSLKVLAQGYHKDIHQENLKQNLCKYFETTIYQNSGNRKRIARTKAWACLNQNDQWIITDEKWIMRDNMISCSGSPVKDSDEGSTIVNTDIPVTQMKNPRWDVRHLVRFVSDYGVERRLKVARRVCTARAEDGSNTCLTAWSAPELADFKAVVMSDNQRAVMLFESPERTSILAPVEDIAIECGVTGLCARNAENRMVISSDGVQGYLQYLYQNGDWVINSSRSGIQTRPENSLRFDSGTAARLR